MDVSQSLEIKHGQNSIHSVEYQTAARQSETQIRLLRWRAYTVVRSYHLSRRGVRQRIEVFYKYQAVCRKMLLPSASDTFCVPLVIRRC